MAVDGLRQSGQWFNLREMKRISAALCTDFFSAAKEDQRTTE